MIPLPRGSGYFQRLEVARDGITVLMATHDLEEMTHVCSHVCAVNHRLVAFGPVASTYTPEVMRATFEGQVALFT